MKICDICNKEVGELTDIYLFSNDCNRQDCCPECFDTFQEPNWFRFRYTFYPFREFVHEECIAKNSLCTSIFWKNFPPFSDIAHEEYVDYYYTKKAKKKTDEECDEITQDDIKNREKQLWEMMEDTYYLKKITNYAHNPKTEEYKNNYMLIRQHKFNVSVHWGDHNDEPCYRNVNVPEHFYVKCEIEGMIYPNEDISELTKFLLDEFNKLRIVGEGFFDGIKCCELKEYARSGASEHYDDKERIEKKLKKYWIQL